MTPLIFILLVLAALPAVYIVIPSVFKIILRKKFLKGIKINNFIYLTFDDGPCPESTPRILDLLKEHDVKATFFLSGNNIEKYPKLVDKILAGGHAAGCHGYNHLHPWKTDPYNSILDFKKFNNSLKKTDPSAISVKLYRPPYGKFNLVTLAYILLSHKKSIFWDIDPEDYRNPDPYSIASYIIDRIDTNCVILLHDGRSSRVNTPVGVTVKAVELILKTARKSGKEFSKIEINN